MHLIRQRLRPPLPIRAVHPGQQRHHATSGRSASYHSKVYALPFTIPPGIADDVFHMYAASLPRPSMQTVMEETVKGMWELGGLDPFSLKTFGKVNEIAQTFLWQREKMGAVYLPTWLAQACVTLRYKLRERDEVESKSFGLLDVPIPGHGYPPLANLWLSEPWSGSTQPEPFTPSMLRTKWGDEVTTVKYTVSPLRLLELASNLPTEAGEFPDQGITILSGIKATGHVTPLLRPVYVCTYITPYNNHRVTLILPAWADTTRPILGSIAMELLDSVYGPTNPFDPPARAHYSSQVTEANSNVGLTMSVMHDLYNPRSLWQNIAPKIVDVIKEARQKRIDWSTIGGVSEEMWDDERIVPYDEKKWPELKTDIVRQQQKETLLGIFRNAYSDLSEEEIERKATVVSKYLDKLRAQDQAVLSGLALEDVEKAAEEDEKKERETEKT